jgi:alkanesulfonate monooxygenase SsuD/methylene tetrahydromethanopterin reductase-like flavin-dependent oxidoreductase (luciferase family)
MFGRIGRERGWSPPTREQFESEIKYGSLYVGSPETVAQKIAYAMKSVGAQRFDFKYCNGPMTQKQMLHSIELYATQVIPRVKELLA